MPLKLNNQQTQDIMKHFTALIFFLFFVNLSLVKGQNLVKELTLRQAHKLIELNHPKLKNAAIYADISAKEIEKLNKANLPSIALKADGKIQSHSVKLDLPPGSNLPFTIDMPLYSAKTFLESQFTIYDGGVNKAQQTISKTNLISKESQLNVTKFQLNEQVNSLFLSINLLKEKSKLFNYSLKSLEQREKQITAAVQEGVVIPGELTKIQVKEIKLLAEQANVNHQIKALLAALSALLLTDLNSDTELILPTVDISNALNTSNRPEKQYLDAQKENINANKTLIDAARKPKIGAFAQSGYGYPNPLNFLDNNTSPYALAGIKFNWAVTDWKQSSLSKEILDLKQLELQNANDAIDFTLNVEEGRFKQDIERLKNQIMSDQKIAAMQNQILTYMEVQLDEGTITSAEYLTQVNAELLAQQTILIHQTELQKTIIEFYNNRGGFNQTIQSQQK